MDGRSARLGTGEWDADGSLFLDNTLTTFTDSLDDGGFHSKFNPVQGDEPDDVLYTYIRCVRRRLLRDWKRNTYPDPNNTDSTTRDLNEAPVTIRSKNGRDELGDAERAHECCRRPLHKEAVRTCDEDEGL